ncbi:hypothetical protein SC898_004591 [Salmonella enterica]|nr:hypothetical protein [Salmonella enterica]EDU3680876.1 hypothetical protein [Salmonella enterica subsp. enterica serovar Baildon]ELU7720758.1 hypothetical protein [Salmonella enterica]
MADSKVAPSLVAVGVRGDLRGNDFERRIFQSGQKMKPLQVRQTLQGHDHLTNSVFGNRHSGDMDMIPQPFRTCPLWGGLHETQ